MKILKLTKSELKTILSIFPEITKKKDKFKEYFFGRLPGVTIHIYQNNTLLVQGDSKFIENFLKKIKVEQNKSEEKINFNYWGGDESGVGDFFGPIVLTLFWCDPFVFSEIKNLNLIDSKKLSDAQIFHIAENLLSMQLNWKIKIISNEELCEMFENGKNLKEIIAWNYLKLIETINHKKDKIFIDGFIQHSTFIKYVQKWNWKEIKNIEFIPKGENQYKGIAAASIISRYFFLKEISKIEKQLKANILLGANKKVKRQMQKFINLYGVQNVKKFAKVNYNYKI